VHLCLAPQALHIRNKLPLIAPYRTAQRVIVFKCSAESKGKDGRKFEALAHYASMVTGRRLVELLVGAVFTYHHSEFTRGKKKYLISE
jgi:hypothetical protein